MQRNTFSFSDLCQEFPCIRNVRAPLGRTWQARLEEKYSLGLIPSTLHSRELAATLVLDTQSGLSASLLQVSFHRLMPKELPLCWGALASPPDAMVHPGGCSRITHLRWPRATLQTCSSVQYLQPSLSWEESFSTQKGKGRLG